MSVQKQRDPAEILLVEDNPGDVRLVREAFKESKFKHRLRVARDGVEAMECLLGDGSKPKGWRPDLIFLDLNLPKKDGRQVLVEVKSHEALRHIPVIVLTSSNAEIDINKCYELHANCFLTKPTDLDEFFRMMRDVENFWLSHARLPGD